LKPQVAKTLNAERKAMLQQLRKLTAGRRVTVNASRHTECTEDTVETGASANEDTADTGGREDSSSLVEAATSAFQYMCLAQCSAAHEPDLPVEQSLPRRP
jgi:hypothetical protein